jgi:hypothetical protein
MANVVLAERGEEPIGKCWIGNFKTRMSLSLGFERAVNTIASEPLMNIHLSQLHNCSYIAQTPAPSEK